MLTKLHSLPFSHFYDLFGNEPSPPLQFGDGGMTVPASCIAVHCVGVLATIDKACTGPSNSSAKIEFTRRCRAKSGVPSKSSDTTNTLKCVSEFFGLAVAEKRLLTLLRDE